MKKKTIKNQDNIVELLELGAISEEEAEKMLEEDNSGLSEVDETVEGDNIGDIYASMSDSTGILLKEITAFPVLTPEEEYELSVKVYTEADEAAKKLLVDSNYRLVVSVIKRYLWSGVPFLDLFQDGAIGLMKAVDRFNPFKGYKLSTYATWWIRQSVSRSICETGTLVRIPVHMHDVIRRVKKSKEILYNEYGREPTIEEIEDRTGISSETIMSALKSDIQPVSYEMPIGEDGDTTLLEMIPSRDNTEDDAHMDEMKAVLDNALNSLPTREMIVMRMRSGLDGTDKGKTLQECGEYLGITRERVRQIESKALRKLRVNSKKLGLQDISDMVVPKLSAKERSAYMKGVRNFSGTERGNSDE